MAVVPIGTYFATLKYFTKGEYLVLRSMVPQQEVKEQTIGLLVLS